MLLSRKSLLTSHLIFLLITAIHIRQGISDWSVLIEIDMSFPCSLHIQDRRYGMSYNNQFFDTVDGSSGRSSSLEKWESLTIQNRFLFAKVMGQKENCLPLLQRLFPEFHITDIRYVEAEKTVEGSIDSKAVRLDVYVQDSDKRAFTLEMQVDDRGNLPMRSRYYSSMIDEDLLSKGQDYDEILPAYVIFICPFDLFEKGLHRYTFMNYCSEDPSLPLGDGSAKIFLNTKGTANDVSKEVLAFLDYINGTFTPDDKYISLLDLAVRKARKNAVWRREFMKYEDEMRYERKWARAEGLAEGRAEGRAVGRAEGRAEGRTEGETLKLIKLVSKKILKGKSVSVIASELEEPEDTIKPVFDLLVSNPEATPEEILGQL